MCTLTVSPPNILASHILQGIINTLPYQYLLGRGRRSGLVAGAVVWVEGGRDVRLGERFSGPTLTERPPIGMMQAQNHVI